MLAEFGQLERLIEKIERGDKCGKEIGVAVSR